MPTVKEIFEYLNGYMPVETAMEYDNVGILAGNPDKEVKTVLVALDITMEVIEEAKKLKADLILSHHPILFDKLGKFTTEKLKERKIVTLLENKIALISMHTNYDTAEGGICDILGELLGAKNLIPFGTIRAGKIKKTPAMEFLYLVKNTLQTKRLKYVLNTDFCENILFCSGSGGDFLYQMENTDYDTLVTADCKHNHFLDARDLGKNIIDAGHFETEAIALDRFIDLLKSRFSGLKIQKSNKNKSVIKYL